MKNFLKIIKESGIHFSGNLLGIGLSYFWLILVTRVLNPTEFGIFTLSQSIINIALIFALIGTPKALDRFIPYFNAINEVGKIKILIKKIFIITLILSCVIGLIISLSSDVFSQKIFQNMKLSAVLKIMVISIPLLVFIQLVSSSFIGFKELRYQVYITQIIFPAFKVIFTLVMILLGYGLFGWIWFYITSLAIATIFAFYLFKKKIHDKYLKVESNSISFKQIFLYSWPLSINSIVTIIMDQIDFLLLGVFNYYTEIGIYRIYCYITLILTYILGSFAQIYKPVISEIVSLGNLKEIKSIYQRVARWIFIINGFFTIILIVYGSNIIKILFTVSYFISPEALIFLVVGKFINSTYGTEAMTLESFANTKLSMFNSIIMLIIKVGIDYFLIPKFGIIGAGISTAVALVMGGMAGLIEIYVLHALQPFTIHHIKYIICIIVTGSIAYLIKLFILDIGIILMIILFIFLGGIYIITLHYTKSLDDLDVKILKSVVNKIHNISGRRK